MDPQGTSTIWTASRLRSTLGALGLEGPVVVLANREPFRHERGRNGEPVVVRSASGLVTALEPLVAACRGTWVAHGSGSADRETVTVRDGLAVPPDSPAYRLRRVWLDRDEQRHYYYGFANEALWPLCHRVHVAPTFRTADFETYASVNERFAAAVCDEAGGDSALVMVQDYHFALAPAAIRRRLGSATIVTFWHIPWPSVREFEICPWARALVRGLLGSNLVGFHTAADVDRFLDAAESLTDVAVDHRMRTVQCEHGTTMVRAYPIATEWPDRTAGEAPPCDSCRSEIRERLNCPPDARLIVGVDRLDYTKGIPEKVLAVERLLERSPALRGRVVFVQIAEPSRECLPEYRALRRRVHDCVARINGRFGTGTYRPMILREAHHEPPEVYRYLRAADVCFVGSLHDGMNLVAKEFVAARDDERGVLVLSRFTGAATQLVGALLVNPYATDETAAALAAALSMPVREQALRMQSMRSVASTFNSYWWAGQMLRDVARLRRKSGVTSEPRVAEAIPA